MFKLRLLSGHVSALGQQLGLRGRKLLEAVDLGAVLRVVVNALLELVVLAVIVLKNFI